MKIEDEGSGMARTKTVFKRPLRKLPSLTFSGARNVLWMKMFWGSFLIRSCRIEENV